MHPADDDDYPVFEGRFNMGAISLHLPMILAKARKENKDFYEVLDYYLEMIRNLHKRTYDYLGEKKAGTNPIGFMQGGFLGGNLGVNDKIKPLLKPMTMSFGITALNELQYLYNKHTLVEDNEFALEVMKHINEYVDRIKEEDGILYAIYGTPAESLCFSGDTIVQTYSGNKQIKDIKNGDLVYSFNEAEKKIELKPVIYAGLTSIKAKVVRVNFTNGQHIVCTPDHKFAKRKINQDINNGKFTGGEYIEYIKAKDLNCGDRIKSNYIIINSDGHYLCSTNQYIHDINAEYIYGKKPNNYVVHHINENKLDNSFDNLEYKLDSSHRRDHMSKAMIDNQFTHENTIGNKNPFWNKKHSEESKEINKIKHLGANNVSSKMVVKTDLDGNIIDIYESKGIAEKENELSNLSYACNGKYTTKNNSHEYHGYLWFYYNNIENFDIKNHIVESVEYLEEEIPVYDITVKDNHNFYVGGDNGILVHNCGLQVEQFRKIYGVVEGVSDKPYVSNSFHCHVSEHITPILKQDKEGEFWDYFNGGKIQYCRYTLGYNTEAIKTLVLRAMEKGFYEGVNLDLCYCEDCGHEQVDMNVCPKCGSKNLTIIDRMNGYLGYTRVKGVTRYNPAKNAEIADRVSM